LKLLKYILSIKIIFYIELLLFITISNIEGVLIYINEANMVKNKILNLTLSFLTSITILIFEGFASYNENEEIKAQTKAPYNHDAEEVVVGSGNIKVSSNQTLIDPTYFFNNFKLFTNIRRLKINGDLIAPETLKDHTTTLEHLHPEVPSHFFKDCEVTDRSFFASEIINDNGTEKKLHSMKRTAHCEKDIQRIIIDEAMFKELHHNFLPQLVESLTKLNSLSLVNNFSLNREIHKVLDHTHLTSISL